MILLHLLVLLASVAVGLRAGGIAIGFAGGLGVLVLGFLGAEPGAMPLTVVSFIMVVIVAVAAMQASGGMDYLVHLAERLLRSRPRYLSLLGPLVIYVLTFTASTGQASFATMPVIVEVAKENGIRPQRALTVGVAGSLLAIVASPVSAAVIFLSGLLEEQGDGWGYIELLMVSIPATFFGVMLTAAILLAWDTARGRTSLETLPGYDRRVEDGAVRLPAARERRALPPSGRRSVIVFLTGLALVLGYAVAISDTIGFVADPVMSGSQVRLAGMLATALAIVLICRTDVAEVPRAATFRIGMTACVCILGVAWLGTTFMDAHEATIAEVAGDAFARFPWLLAVAVALASALLYSQAAATQALMPTALAMGLPPVAVVAAFPATSTMFMLPNYPTLIAAVELDDTGSTRLGRRVVDHPFLVPGLLATGLSVVIGFGLASVVPV